MEPDVKQIVEHTFAKIISLQNHIDNVHAAQRAVGRDHNLNCGNLIQTLYAEQVREWKNLFMFGMVMDDETKDRIKAAAYQHFLSDRIHVADYYSNASYEWMEAGEDEFRRMCRELFAPENVKEAEKEILRELSVEIPKKKIKVEFSDEI